jgi:hypothetical protein
MAVRHGGWTGGDSICLCGVKRARNRSLGDWADCRRDRNRLSC